MVEPDATATATPPPATTAPDIGPTTTPTPNTTETPAPDPTPQPTATVTVTPTPEPAPTGATIQDVVDHQEQLQTTADTLTVLALVVGMVLCLGIGFLITKGIRK